ncbi:alpha/beta fold hydrolase [Nitriliruptor alkaliphilus]|uniref:alpha/beta fold hydrolase n=1 Tax=Nitriliruptor alkaliphilus TaxID=427918 RepID=UPI000695EB50|nr:alpha/beta fold hydrolase [Nitriliruptor alkaliphilus]
MSIWLDLTPHPFCIEYVDAGGVRTRALTAGEGEDVIFLHGTSGHLEAFSRNIGAYVDAGYRCHAIDALGHGYTDPVDEPYELPRYAQHVLDYLDAQGIDRVHIVGESLGGWIAAYVGSDHPERVRSIQLVASGGTKAVPAVMARIKNSTREAVLSDDRALTEQRLHLLMADPEADVTDELVDVRYRIYHQPRFQEHLDNLLGLQEMERRQRNLLTEERMAKLTMPVLVIWGRDNPFGEIPEAQKMHEAIPGSELVLFDDCGHWPQHEKADEYHPIAFEFLAKASSH